MISLNDPINRLHLVGPAQAQALSHLGVRTVSDLLHHFPRQWQDLSIITPIASLRTEKNATIKAAIKKFSQFRSPRRRLSITQALLEDGSGSILALWYNQPFLRNTLREGREYYFAGKITNNNLQNPAFELVKSDTIHTAGIVPVYDLTEGVTQKQIRYWIKRALQGLTDIADFLPRTILTKLNLPELHTAVHDIHFPANRDNLERARGRLAFDELFLLQVALLSSKKKVASLPAPKFAFNRQLVKKFVASLPFALTRSQRLAAWEILRDLARPHPMNRLLEGEVGSGKTVVAGIAMLQVAAAGWQSVLLAPTEILAWQHFQTLKKLYENTALEVAILTRSHKETSGLQRPEPGTRNPENRSQNLTSAIRPLTSDFRILQSDIIIGTHALLQEHIRFKRIGLLVVDEQHRFGVEQRAKLLAANQNNLVPHLLSMTATPIPRTLALAFYGDLDISRLPELPAGRKKIVTRLVAPENREKAYEFIRKKLAEGQRAYVVVPLIEADESASYKSVVSESEKLQTIFPEFRVGMLHGRLSGEEKKHIMDDFKTGQTHLLVTTTVVEVGVDVPQASLMVIENAERFGLSQLHQLRGRVGRGQQQSYCLLFSESTAEITKKRLQAVVNSADGFELAEIDLRLRGPGEVLGTAQSGYIPLKIARLSDSEIIRQARREAEALLTDDNPDNYPVLKQKIAALAKDIHLE